MKGGKYIVKKTRLDRAAGFPRVRRKRLKRFSTKEKKKLNVFFPFASLKTSSVAAAAAAVIILHFTLNYIKVLRTT